MHPGVRSHLEKTISRGDATSVVVRSMIPLAGLNFHVGFRWQ